MVVPQAFRELAIGSADDRVAGGMKLNSPGATVNPFKAAPNIKSNVNLAFLKKTQALGCLPHLGILTQSSS